MTRLIGLSLFFLLALPQDPAVEIDRLVEKLGSQELAVREAGATGLVKLGLRALPELQKRIEGADSGLRVRLQGVIRKIESDARISAVLEGPKPVTLKLKEASCADVFAELGRQTGYVFHYDRLNKDLKLTIDVAGVEPWSALDELCRRNGLSWGPWSSEKPGEMLFTKYEDWIEPTRFKSGGLTVELLAFDCGYLQLYWNVFHGPAPTFQLVRFEVDELRDSRGKDLKARMTEEEWNRHWAHGPPKPPKAPSSGARVSTVNWRSAEEITPDVEILSVLKGRLILETTFKADPPDRHEIVIPIDLKEIPLR